MGRNDDMVGATGVEPARITPQDPKSCASANSATRPWPAVNLARKVGRGKADLFLKLIAQAKV